MTVTLQRGNDVLSTPFCKGYISISIFLDFGELLDQQLKHIISEFADIMEKQQGLPPHRGYLDHKVKITGYPLRRRINKLSIPEYKEQTRQCTEIIKEG
jgi:hypothetical protein